MDISVNQHGQPLRSITLEELETRGFVHEGDGNYFAKDGSFMITLRPDGSFYYKVNNPLLSIRLTYTYELENLETTIKNQ